MTELYNLSYASEQQKRLKKQRAVIIASGLLSLGVCALLCLFVTTRTARALFIPVSVISILWGWAYLLWLAPQKRACKAQYVHTKNVLSSTETAYHTGIVSVSPYEIQVPGSIRVKNVRLSDGEKTESLLLNAAFSLPADRARLTLRCAGKYVAAYEVAEDEKVQ